MVASTTNNNSHRNNDNDNNLEEEEQQSFLMSTKLVSHKAKKVMLPTIQSEQSLLHYNDEDDDDEEMLLQPSSDSNIISDDEEEDESTTFERSFGLLGNGWIGVQRVKDLTELRLNPSSSSSVLFSSGLKRFNQFGGTPDIMYSRKTSKNNKIDDDTNFIKIQKIKSLDFVPNRNNSISSNHHYSTFQKERTNSSNNNKNNYTSNNINGNNNKKNKKATTKDDDVVVSTGSKKTTFAQSIFNMSNTLMGIGILSLPYAVASVGWIAGMFILLFFTFLTWYTCLLIGRLLSYKPKGKGGNKLSSLSQVAMASFGLYGNIGLSAVLYFELFSCLSIFLVTMGDHLFALYPSISHSMHMITITAVLSIPTALLRTPQLLSYMSAVGTFATIAVVFSVLTVAVLEGDITTKIIPADVAATTDDEYHSLWISSGFPLCAGLIAFAYSGHAIIPSFYHSMDQPEKNFEKVLTYSYGIVLVSYLIVSICGYYTFGSTVQDQVTLSLESITSTIQVSLLEHKLLKGLTWLMIVTAFSKATLYVFPLSLGVEELILSSSSSSTSNLIRGIGVKIIILVLALLVAISVPSFGTLCALVGLICTMIVSFIFPAAAHLKLFSYGDKTKRTAMILDCLVICIALAVAIPGTIATTTMSTR